MKLVECQLPANGSGESGGGGRATGASWISRTGWQFNVNLCNKQNKGFGGHLTKTEN